MKISIITPTFNVSKTIEDCIKSIDEQNHDDYEHIIVDGRSNDGTVKIARENISPKRVLISEADKGIYDAMNKGILMSSGDIIAILNGDDFYSDNQVLSLVNNAFEKNKIDSCYGDLLYVDEKDSSKVIRYWKSCPYNDKLFYKGWMPQHPTFFVKRKIYNKYGLYNLVFGTAADYELMLRLLLKYKISTYYIPQVLVQMRTGGKSNVSFRNRILANMNDRKAWELNGLKPKPWTLYLKPLSKIKQFF